jgi:hypothetical protein
MAAAQALILAHQWFLKATLPYKKVEKNDSLMTEDNDYCTDMPDDVNYCYSIQNSISVLGAYLYNFNKTVAESIL